MPNRPLTRGGRGRFEGGVWGGGGVVPKNNLTIQDEASNAEALPLQAPRPATEPRSPKHPKCITIKIFGLHIKFLKIFLCNLCNVLHAHYIF